MTKFVIVDGPDGSGKGTIVNGFAKLGRGKTKVLDLREYCSLKGRFPSLREIENAEVIVSCEPTFCFTGKAIREEMVRSGGKNYSAISLAQAFSLDREMLYKSVILPALNAGKCIFQERGVTSSLVYQPIQGSIQVRDLLGLPGNALAVQNAPSLLLITKTSPETALKRLRSRSKKDDSIFDNLDFQRKVGERYSSRWLRELFEKRGSKVEYLDTDEPKSEREAVKEAAAIVEKATGIRLQPAAK